MEQVKKKRKKNWSLALWKATAGLVEEDGGHQELPGVVEKRLLHQVVRRAGGRPLLEGLPPGWAQGYTHTRTRARTERNFISTSKFGAFQTNTPQLSWFFPLLPSLVAFLLK